MAVQSSSQNIVWKYESQKKKFRIRETRHLLTNADSSIDTNKILIVRQNSPKEYNFFLRGNFTPFTSKSFQIWDHLFLLLFLKDSKIKEKKFEHWTSGSWGKKTFERNEQRRKKWVNNYFFLPLRLYTLFEQRFSNLRPLCSITFPQGFRLSKKFGHWTLGTGGKKNFKRSEKHQFKKNPAQ